VVMDSLDGTTETGISEGEVIDESMRPVLGSRIVHDFLEARVDEVNLVCTAELSHVRGVGRDRVAHHAEEFFILLGLISLCHATGSDMRKVLEPLEVRARNTTSVSKHVGNNDHTLGIENFLSHEGSGTVCAFKDDITVEKIGVVFVDSFLFSSGDQNVARLLHERCGIDCFNLLGMAVVFESSFA